MCYLLMRSITYNSKISPNSKQVLAMLLDHAYDTSGDDLEYTTDDMIEWSGMTEEQLGNAIASIMVLDAEPRYVVLLEDDFFAVNVAKIAIDLQKDEQVQWSPCCLNYDRPERGKCSLLVSQKGDIEGQKLRRTRIKKTNSILVNNYEDSESLVTNVTKDSSQGDKREKKPLTIRSGEVFQLLEVFTDITKIPQPDMTRGRKSYALRTKMWLNPLRDMLNACEGDFVLAKNVLEMTVRQMIGANLTISDPNSVYRPFMSELGKVRRGQAKFFHHAKIDDQGGVQL